MSTQPQHIEVIGRGLVVLRGRALLCRDRAGGYHYLPGGHIDPGEPAGDAVRREFVEEAGRDVRIGPLLLCGEQIFTQPNKSGQPKRRHEINLIFSADLRPLDDSDTNSTDGWPIVESQESHIAFDWIELAAVPDLDIRPASAKALLLTGGRRDHKGGLNTGPDLGQDAGPGPEWISEVS
ncbi:MAG: NUDIX domain-containing protein [Planctomycetota bacterium]